MLDGFFEALPEKRISPEALAQNTGYSVLELRDKKNRIEWEAWLTFADNCSRVWTDAELIELGGAFTKSKVLRAFFAIARLLYSPKDFYKWTVESMGAGAQMFTPINSTYREVTASELEIKVLTADGYAVSPQFFLFTLGGFRALPKALRVREATVEITMVERGAIYVIHVPNSGSRITSFFRKLIAWPMSARIAAIELKEAYETLLKRNQELESSRLIIDEQARRLQTAHTIGLALRRANGLDATLAVASELLVSEGLFSHAQIFLTRDAEGRSIATSAEAGVSTLGHALNEHLLVSRGETVGRIVVAIPRDQNQESLTKLIDFLMPTLSTAIDDALAMTSLSDYRENLERKVVERTEELKKARDEIARNFNELQAAKLARDRIFANVNHELRTPLSLILLAAEATRDREAKTMQERSRVDLANVAAGGRRLLRLIDDLLALAAGQEGKLELSIFASDVAQILDQVVTMWLPAAEKFKVGLVYEGPQTATIEVDPQAFERMITNLVSNAIKFTPGGGTITVALTASSGSVQVSVRDTGIGLSEDFKQRAFGRFEQGAAAVNATSRGSGIGLSLVKTLAEAHRGSVSVESQEGAGTTFTITLPAKQDYTKVRAPTESAQLILAPSDFGLRPTNTDAPTVLESFGEATATALVAEDDPELRGAIAEVLRADYRVLVASDGVQALALAHKHLPDVLVSDIGMPGMDGFELSRRFRELPGNRLAPVILLTAFRTLKDRLIGFESGAVDYITKPFDPEELKARVRSQLAVRDLALRLHEAEKIATLSVLSSGLAHEFRNPANGIVNAIEPIKEILAGETLVERESLDQLLRVVSEGAAQIRHLSKHLLGVGRQGDLQLRKESFPLIARRALAMLTPPAGVIVEDKSDFAGEVFCAAPLLTQSLCNLLENAVQACGRDGCVTLAAHSRGDWLDIEVHDSGTGIAADMRERVFDPFFTTKGPGGGTGLGLTTARQIAASHGGTLTVSDAASGATLVLRLPLTDTARYQATAAREAAAAATAIKAN